MMLRIACLIPLLFVLAVGSANRSAFAAGGVSLRAATAASVSSGKPIFAVYGTKSCPHCVALMKRLETDQTLAPYANRFVVMKIEQEDPDWPVFNQRYATDRNAVPRLYIIGADGSSIVKQVGAPRGDDLPQMLHSALEQAGPMLTPGRVDRVEAVAKLTGEMDLTDDWAKIAYHLFTIEDDLSAGNQSWKSIGQASKGLNAVEVTMAEKLDAARKKLTDDVNDFGSLVTWAKVVSLYGTSSSRRKQGAAFERELKKINTDRQMIDHAIELAESEILSFRDDKRSGRRAAKRLALVIRSSEHDGVIELATKMLADIDPDYSLAASDSASTTEAEFRLWKAGSGEFSKTAKLVQSSDTHVQLEDRDGKKMTVRIDQLSESDQKYIGQRQSKD